MSFAENLRTLLTEYRLPQEDLARQCNVSASAVSNWVTGRREPDMAMLVKIADIFGVSTDILLGHYNPADHTAQATFLRSCKKLTPMQQEFVQKQIDLLCQYTEDGLLTPPNE